ncbi:hypothetical protein PTKIN_Ptkin14bG0085000 [Pterospermum kingtungense]
MNVIEIWGYCMDGKHRLLVYEFMEHGSLTKDLSFGSTDWRNRSEIAVGTAKGLACDIKPRNILLIDSSYQPKVSDFGLSWLLKRGDIKHSGFSRIRGTRGRNPAMGVHSSTDGEGEEEQGTLVTWEEEDARPTMGQVVEMLVFSENNLAANALGIGRKLIHGL